MHNISGLLKTAFVVVLTTAVGFVFAYLGIHEANIITLYILSVLVIAVWTSSRLYSIASSIVNVFLFNFFFTAPKYTFRIQDSTYLITFLVMFIAAFITGSLALKIQNSARQSAQTASRTELLFETNKLLQKAATEQDAAETASRQLAKLLERNVLFVLLENNIFSDSFMISPNGQKNSCIILEDSEKSAVDYALRNRCKAGAGTTHFSQTKYQYLTVNVNENVYGIVGISYENILSDSFENSIILSIIGECALAIENLHNIAEKENAAVLAKNEQLRANLLRSISHDLRTPLTSISGNADILMSSGDVIEKEARFNLYRDIHEDSLWLIALVENILSVTRIEDGTMKLNMNSELIEDAIQEAVLRVPKNCRQRISITSSDEILLARMDARLIVQVIFNILDNAIKYTPENSSIHIHFYEDNHWIVIEIADQGGGIPDEDKQKIFDMFYTAATKIADSRRSMGLGLSLCKSIIHSHGGKIEVYDNQPSGAVFRFTVPAEEVKLHESFQNFGSGGR